MMGDVPPLFQQVVSRKTSNFLLERQSAFFCKNKYKKDRKDL